MNNKVLFLLGMIISGSSLLAQENQSVFSLEEAMNYAVEHNRELINASRDVNLAQQQYKETIGAGLPQLSGSVDYSTNFNYELDLFGTSIPLKDQASANLQVTQLLFSGQYWVGIQLAKLGERIATLNMKSTELDIKENVVNTYYMILINEELLKILGQNINDLESILVHTENMFKVGMMEQTDADQVLVNLSQLQDTKNSMERSLEYRYNIFRFVLGLETEQVVVLSDDLSKMITGIEEYQQWDLNFEPTLNPTYQILMTSEEMGKENLAMNKWAYAPMISGYYNYKEKFMTTDFDMSPKNMAGLSLSIPILEGGSKRAKVSQSKIELDKIRTDRSMLEDQLMLQNNQFYFELTNAYENYNTQKQSVEVAQRVYASYNNKFKQGMVSSLELTQANSNYLQAENNYISAILNVLQAELKLNKLYNRL